MEVTMERKLLEWFITGETGKSSVAIASVMAGIPGNARPGSEPADPSDLKRCLKLIRDIPEIRPRLQEMSSVSETWKKMVDRWDDLEECFMSEIPEWLDDKGKNKIGHKTMSMMLSLRIGGV